MTDNNTWRRQLIAPLDDTYWHISILLNHISQHRYRRRTSTGMPGEVASVPRRQTLDISRIPVCTLPNHKHNPNPNPTPNPNHNPSPSPNPNPNPIANPVLSAYLNAAYRIPSNTPRLNLIYAISIDIH